MATPRCFGIRFREMNRPVPKARNSARRIAARSCVRPPFRKWSSEQQRHEFRNDRTGRRLLSANSAITSAFDKVANGMRLTVSSGVGSFQVNYGAGSSFGPENLVLSNYIPEPGTALLVLIGTVRLLISRARRIIPG